MLSLMMKGNTKENNGNQLSVPFLFSQFRMRILNCGVKEGWKNEV
jgi:hypothetical protein